MERPYPAGSRAFQGRETFEPLPHLRGSLTGEGDGSDLAGMDSPMLDEPCYTVGQGPGFSGTRSGLDQYRPVNDLYGLLLLFIQWQFFFGEGQFTADFLLFFFFSRSEALPVRRVTRGF